MDLPCFTVSVWGRPSVKVMLHISNGKTSIVYYPYPWRLGQRKNFLSLKEILQSGP
jgi:hypothetical protein